MAVKINIDIQTKFLYPGIILKGDSFDEKQNLVNPAKVPFTAELIQQLNDEGIKCIHYQQEKLTYRKAVSDSIIRDQNIEHAIGIIDEVESCIRNKAKKLPEQAILDTIGGFIENIRSNSNAFLNLLDLQEFDNYTYTHSINVATISLLLGSSLNLDEAKLSLLGVAALMHDVGKALVPQDILMKPGKLNEAEWKIMKNHPVYGYNILKKESAFDPRIAQAVLFHHESYSGGGYPLAINKDKQDSFSQIISIADVFDSLTSNTPYKKAWEMNEAFTYLMEESGIKFNPIYTQIFIRDMAKKINELPIYPVDSFVLLNTGEIAVVSGHRKSEFSLRPVVNIFYKPVQGHSASENMIKYIQPVDLEQNYDRFIIKKISDPDKVLKLKQLLASRKSK